MKSLRFRVFWLAPCCVQVRLIWIHSVYPRFLGTWLFYNICLSSYTVTSKKRYAKCARMQDYSSFKLFSRRRFYRYSGLHFQPEKSDMENRSDRGLRRLRELGSQFVGGADEPLEGVWGSRGQSARPPRLWIVGARAILSRTCC
ncbi:uncharacterized protein B0H18DRAFT_444169 [Fomitopsis serialis]|uniref:uncharacterized protein n=1 Tax=Fomitopsis serialis TaxID=139415 RepID=UPI002007E7AC|nr:uncharacterized protein B0H18DRAFT_444169 [Neoantrodia serialis]KAH9924017.1 hypothetical protein B0H18DRAFT_444169 [Neoantrodia serialis]